MENTTNNARFVAFYDGENNGYDDSDFYYMILDTVDNKVIKFVHSTTRCYANSKFPYEFVSVVGTPLAQEYMDRAKEVAKVQVLEKLDNNEIGNWGEKGDIVLVTNPRVRKYKAETFFVTDIAETNYYGKVTTNLLGRNVQSKFVKTADTNCTVLIHSDKKIKNLAERFVLGMRLS